MQFGFEVVAAKSKRPQAEDTSPRQVSMQPRGTKLPRNPTPEEKKVRRGLSRSAAIDGAYFLVDAGGGTIPGTGSYATYSDAEADLAKNNAAAVQWKTTGEPEVNSHQAEPFPPVMNPTVGGKQVSTFNQREAALLDALASPTMTLANKRLLAAELEDIRAEHRLAKAAARETDMADSIVRERMTPVRTHELHTTATDWIAEGDAAEEDDSETPVMAMRTAASLWFGRTSAAVKQDAFEYTEQAKGMARHLAGQYGIHGPQAREAFIAYARHLNKANLVRTADDAAFENDLDNTNPDTEFGWGTEVAQETQPWSQPDTSQPSSQAIPNNPDNTPDQNDLAPENDNDEELFGREARFRRQGSYAIYDKNGTVVDSGYDTDAAAKSALARLIASGAHNAGEGLTVKAQDSEADSDVDAGAASNESNGGVTSRRKYADSTPGSQSGDAVSGLPLSPSIQDQSDPNWDITQWPDTGAAEIPSTRAPVIQENADGGSGDSGVTPDDDAVAKNAAKVISYRGRRYVLAADDDRDGPRGSEESHDQSGDAESTLPDVEVGGPNDQQGPWPWDLPEDVSPDAPMPSGAADEADVPAPGEENPNPGWPQPDDDSKKQSAFRRRVQASQQTPGL